MASAASGGSVFAGIGLAMFALSTCSSTVPAPLETTQQHPLTVVGAGSGDGTAMSDVVGITCTITAGAPSGDCEELYDDDTLVTLTGAPAGGSVFGGWSGAGCAGTAPCEVTMDQAQTVTATFDPIGSLRWLAFAPTNFNPNLGIFPSIATIQADLEVAFSHGFDAIITFASDGTLMEIPRIAREVGFRGVHMGLFMFDEAQRSIEITNAKAAAQFVDGYLVGNEGLIGCGGSFYSADTLLATMEDLRATTGKPVTTSEQIEDYLNGGGCLGGFLRTKGDWLAPIIHPFNNGKRDPATGVAFTVDRLQTLDGLTEKPVCAKETGWPTGGDPAATEENQESYFVQLKLEAVCYAYFEYADLPWKQGSPWERFWGLFNEDRTPKLFVGRNQP